MKLSLRGPYHGANDDFVAHDTLVLQKLCVTRNAESLSVLGSVRNPTEGCPAVTATKATEVHLTLELRHFGDCASFDGLVARHTGTKFPSSNKLCLGSGLSDWVHTRWSIGQPCLDIIFVWDPISGKFYHGHSAESLMSSVRNSCEDKASTEDAVTMTPVWHPIIDNQI